MLAAEETSDAVEAGDVFPVTVLFANSYPPTVHDHNQVEILGFYVLQIPQKLVGVDESITQVENAEAESVLVDGHSSVAVLLDFVNIHLIAQDNWKCVGTGLLVHQRAYARKKKNQILEVTCQNVSYLA